MGEREREGRIDRRQVLKLGAGGLTGATVLAWTKPALSSMRILAGVGTPLVSGNPSIEVQKTVTEVTNISGDNYRIRGTITIENVTDESIPITIESVDDHVEYKSGASWVVAPTTEVVIPCEGQTIAAAGQTCSGPYEVIATIPSSAGGKRNVVEVTARNRDKVFVYRESFEF